MSTTLELTITGRVNGVSISGTRTLAGGDLRIISETIPGSSTDLAALMPYTAAQVQAYILKSDYDLVIEVNDGSSPDKTINLRAGEPILWDVNSEDTNLLSDDSTVWYITEENGDDAELTGYILIDPTA